MQKFIPILFSTSMVQALLEGRKTMTRRTRGLEILNKSDDNWIFDGISEEGEYAMEKTDSKFNPKETYLTIIPSCKIGDIFWVRETFKPTNKDPKKYIYKAASDPVFYKETKWKPSIFMPKEACRVFLKVKEIRVEKILNISKKDAIAEGIDFKKIGPCVEYKNYMSKSNEFDNFNDHSFPDSPQNSFWSLWESINGANSLNKDPFCFVYEFERVEKPLNFNKCQKNQQLP